MFTHLTEFRVKDYYTFTKVFDILNIKRINRKRKLRTKDRKRD